MEPSDEELHAFVGALLSNLDALLREPEVIDETIRDHRQLWLALFRASQDFDRPDS